jgi:hypothetical protein
LHQFNFKGIVTKERLLGHLEKLNLKHLLNSFLQSHSDALNKQPTSLKQASKFSIYVNTLWSRITSGGEER